MSLNILIVEGNIPEDSKVFIRAAGASASDNLRKLVNSGSALIPGASTVNFDEITKERIYQSIDSAKLNKKRDLQQDYNLLKFRIGRIPMMTDFLDYKLSPNLNKKTHLLESLFFQNKPIQVLWIPFLLQKYLLQ